MNDQPVLLFDGVCNFCNSAVNFTIKRNVCANILFAALQSEAGQKLLIEHGLPVDELQSFIFIENGKTYNRSTAALRVCRHLRGIWPLCYALVIIPRFIRDGLYKWIAKNRYKWFGVRKECMIPSAAVKARFLI